MKKLFLLSFLFLLFFSCSNVADVVPVAEDVHTLKKTVIEKEADISWSKSLEEERLTENIYKDESKVSTQISLTPEVISVVYNNELPVYPVLKDFGSLDLSELPSNIKSLVNDFCIALSKNIEKGPELYFDNEFIFNYVFFKNDLINSWNEKFGVAFPEKNIFTKWLLGRPFIGDEILQQPIRLYCQQGYVDVTLYINLFSNKIYQIVEGTYDGKK